jgi:1-phosphatidylinositol-3-phosphate 5-kinase
LVGAGLSPADSSWVQGVACRKSLAHKRMRGSIPQPRVMLLAGGVEAAAPAAAAGAAAASKLSSFGALLDQEQQWLAAAVERIASFSPDVLLVERSVARCGPPPPLPRQPCLLLTCPFPRTLPCPPACGSHVRPPARLGHL